MDEGQALLGDENESGATVEVAAPEEVLEPEPIVSFNLDEIIVVKDVKMKVTRITQHCIVLAPHGWYLRDSKGAESVNRLSSNKSKKVKKGRARGRTKKGKVGRRP